MVKGGDRKHPYAVRKEGDENAGQGDREEKGRYAGQMNKDVGNSETTRASLCRDWVL